MAAERTASSSSAVGPGHGSVAGRGVVWLICRVAGKLAKHTSAVGSSSMYTTRPSWRAHVTSIWHEADHIAGVLRGIARLDTAATSRRHGGMSDRS